MIKCYCPKCKESLRHYIRKGAKKERTMYCWKCNIKFKVNIKDFVEGWKY